MKYYTVYLNSDDSVVASGNSKECAEQLGMTRPSFYCAVYRARNGERKKYSVLVEDIDEDLI